MKTETFKSIVCNCAWLGLMLAGMAFPSQADQLTVQASGSGSATLTVPGFDRSLGSLDEVVVEVIFKSTATVETTSSSPVGFDGELLLLASATIIGTDVTLDNEARISGDVSQGTPLNKTLEDSKELTFSTMVDLEDFELSHVAVPGASSAFIEDGSSIPGLSESFDNSMAISVTYDYTPAVAPVPEPSAVFLLGGATGLCLWRLRKRQARAKGDTL